MNNQELIAAMADYIRQNGTAKLTPLISDAIELVHTDEHQAYLGHEVIGKHLLAIAEVIDSHSDYQHNQKA